MWTPRRLFENVIGHAGIVAGDAVQDAIERNDTRRKEGAFVGSFDIDAYRTWRFITAGGRVQRWIAMESKRMRPFRLLAFPGALPQKV